MGRSPLRSRYLYEQVLAGNRAGDQKCWRCGKGKDDGVSIVVHHADYDAMNNDPRNLVLLCPSCHSWVHRYLLLNFRHMVHVPKFMNRAVAAFMARCLGVPVELADNEFAMQWLVRLFESRCRRVIQPIDRHEKEMLELLLPRWQAMGSSARQ